MIVKILFEPGNGEKPFCMLTGNSYKTWQQQYSEMQGQRWFVEPTKFWKNTKDKWVGWGGLKWCQEDVFQDQLNREGLQHNEPLSNNPNPRQYSKMLPNFEEFEPRFK